METKIKKAIRIAICSAAVALAIAALFYNPAHIFTAGLLFLAGCSVEINEEERV